MKIDADDSGQISVEEWITWWLRRVSCLPNPLKQQEAIAKNTFRKFDTDDSGSLNSYELHALIESLGERLMTVNFNFRHLTISLVVFYVT
jgi:preprotein translocase subunit Sec63